MTSDILILLKQPVDEQQADVVRNAIYRSAATAMVTFDPSKGKTLLVRFDPTKDTPAAILEAVRNTGFNASMAGG